MNYFNYNTIYTVYEYYVYKTYIDMGDVGLTSVGGRQVISLEMPDTVTVEQVYNYHGRYAFRDIGKQEIKAHFDKLAKSGYCKKIETDKYRNFYITLDFEKTQILFIDFEWLGVGRVRMGFVVDGKIYLTNNEASPSLTIFNDPVNDLTDVTIIELTEATGEAPGLVYDSVSGLIYILGGTKIIELDPSDNSKSVVAEVSDLAAGANASIATNGTYLYVGDTNRIAKFDMSDWSRETDIAVTGVIHAMAFNADGSHLFGTTPTNPATFYDIDSSDNVTSFSLAQINVATDEMYVNGNYVYVGSESTNKMAIVDWTLGYATYINASRSWAVVRSSSIR
jgi:hypothetical protein